MHTVSLSQGARTVFGEAITFYTIEDQPIKWTMVVYNPLTDVNQPLDQIRRKWAAVSFMHWTYPQS
ncbi:hypothetical protein K443DRAFT_16153 [Laccaria amethystina LaAM-08-1]|uniref:Uncharacterized protein n=1 Tax=Laccaria amethystina LaAM-08-1 TaxID=1095629 RepID=A0A0C9WKG4_9AGAR|nr:hypothetical protein K443DRAFT_16153 [Laccaria amethystina LaAM-08-1]